MPIPFPSDAWIKALKDVLNADEEYGQIAHNWEGDIMFIVEPIDATQTPIYMYIDLWHGKCRDATQLTSATEKKPTFTLSATLPVFQNVVEGKLDPMQAMMTRKLKVAGSMGYMMRNVPTVLKFVKCTSKVDSQFA